MQCGSPFKPALGELSCVLPGVCSSRWLVWQPAPSTDRETLKALKLWPVSFKALSRVKRHAQTLRAAPALERGNAYCALWKWSDLPVNVKKCGSPNSLLWSEVGLLPGTLSLPQQLHLVAGRKRKGKKKSEEFSQSSMKDNKCSWHLWGFSLSLSV